MSVGLRTSKKNRYLLYIMISHIVLIVFFLIFDLRIDYGDGPSIRLGYACSLISQALLNTERHMIHQIKAEYHSNQLVLIEV